jgi:hypothetical protein
LVGDQIPDVCDLGAKAAAATRRVSGGESAQAIALAGGGGGEAKQTGCESPLALVLELPGGAKVQINDAKQAALAAALLRALAKPC